MEVFYQSLARHSTVAYLFQLQLGGFRGVVCVRQYQTSGVQINRKPGLRLESEHPIASLIIVVS